VLLAAQKNEVELKNQEVEEARKSLEEKANQLTLTSKYKSEFLANMSHELRTPLNSLQILAHELIQNHDGNLTEKQIQFAKTINACGEDLIQLINDILDLSKIESGYISVDYSPVRFSEITKYVDNTFKHISEAKNLKFTIEADNDLPEILETDPQRLNQILKNLLSNSFKFTEKGEVGLKIYKADHNWKPGTPSLDNADTVIAFEISDTGIGISKDKQNIIFEAFQQAEGSTSRKYGGTGLGLSISRGLSDLLGGTIELESVPDQGSKFTLFLPVKVSASVENKQLEMENKAMVKEALKTTPDTTFHLSEIEQYFIDEVGDDRLNIAAGDKVILIVDRDIEFARTMLEKAHANGIKVVATTKGSDMIDFLNQFRPQAIILNINLQDTNGWKIMDRLKNDLTLRHIPVYISSSEEDRDNALKRGARNFLVKPVKEKMLTHLFTDILDFTEKKARTLLIVDDNAQELDMVVKAVEGDDIEVTTAQTARDAIKLVREKNFDCIILDLVLPDAQGLDIIKELENDKSEHETALIVYSAKDLNPKEKERLKQFANSIILKSAHSLSKLVDQTALFLHRTQKDLPEKMRETIDSYYLSDDCLAGKKVLIVDDDMRNLFALTTALERFGLNIMNAESGQEAINKLESNPDLDIILMDIMMPEMDGYETMKRIRSEEKNRDLTIIALTAKAMKGDRQKCIESGASDYITKPVNVEQLLSLMRVWLK
jgi:signal transduction histidine kinase/DNA-binding response OmpR family regulator